MEYEETNSGIGFWPKVTLWAAVLGFGGYLVATSPDVERIAEPDSGSARAEFGMLTEWRVKSACKQQVLSELHDPERAEWIGASDWHVSYLEDGDAYATTAYFRAPNLMGGMVRGEAFCLVGEGGGHWGVRTLHVPLG